MSGTERRTVRPSAALFITDGFTGSSPREPVEIRIGTSRQRTVVTPSGYVALFGLAPGTALCTIACNGFRPERVSLEIGDGKPEAREVTLSPLPSYPFPPGATLLRGTVLEEGAESRVEGVSVSLVAAGQRLTSVTDERGEFVLFIRAFGADGVKKTDHDLLARGPDGTTDLIPELTKPGYRQEREEKVSLSIGLEKRMSLHLTRGGS